LKDKFEGTIDDMRQKLKSGKDYLAIPKRPDQAKQDKSELGNLLNTIKTKPQEYLDKVNDYYQVKKNEYLMKKEELKEKVNQRVKRYYDIKDRQVMVKRIAKWSIFSSFIGLNTFMFLRKFYFKKTIVDLTHFCFYSGAVCIALNMYVQWKINAHYKTELKGLLR
jgi:hypothetical protein